MMTPSLGSVVGPEIHNSTKRLPQRPLLAEGPHHPVPVHTQNAIPTSHARTPNLKLSLFFRR